MMSEYLSGSVHEACCKQARQTQESIGALYHTPTLPMFRGLLIVGLASIVISSKQW